MQRTTGIRTCPTVAAAVVVALLAALVGGSEARAQSLLRKSRSARSLIADFKAAQIGDILTLIIEEQQQIANSEDSSFSKSQSLQFTVDDFDVKPNPVFSVLPNIVENSSKDFEGEASYNKQGRFEARLAVVVIDVQPNGQLIIEGRRVIKFDNETKTMRITGIVRPRDIAPDNTIRSRAVANARIEYEGDGPLTRNTNQGWLEEILDILWPF